MQGSFFEEPSSGKEIILKDGELAYYPQFINAEESDFLMQTLLNTINWKQESLVMYGKKVPFPRLMAWYGDSVAPYSFSGNTFIPQPWTRELLQIKNRIEPVAGQTFNSVLLNLYRSGNDSMGWHADDEQELGPNPVIASMNFGATRRFLLRYKTDHHLKYEIALQHGSLLIMKGTLQQYWEHQVPKTAIQLSGRVNLTFRFIHP